MDSFVRAMFKALRFDKAHHVGLGDIRLTMAQQDDLCDKFDALAAELVAVKIENGRAFDETIPALAAERDRLAKENDYLRALVGNSDKACVYCGLGSDEQGQCERGFPGCARADDQLLCREVGAALERDRLAKELAEARGLLGLTDSGAYALALQVRALAAERERLRDALERTLLNFERILSYKPVRDATETIAEARAALAGAPDNETGRRETMSEHFDRLHGAAPDAAPLCDVCGKPMKVVRHEYEKQYGPGWVLDCKCYNEPSESEGRRDE